MALFSWQDFDHVTERLGDDIMDFVNDVASVVHENVSAWGGNCNKNLGGSFLMTWKVPEVYTRGSTAVDVSRIPYIAKIADRALIGFVKTVADLNRDEKIMAYRTRKDMFTRDKTSGQLLPFEVEFTARSPHPALRFPRTCFACCLRCCR